MQPPDGPFARLCRSHENRRDYYRMLHVGPDASPEVIRARYRTLMRRLGMHPDLGGDPEHAGLVNET